MLRLVCLCLIFGLLGLPATAERQFLGYGRLLNNDSVLGDGQDRWHTGSIAASRVWGGGWQGALPTRPGDLLELRLNFQVIAPTQLGLLNPADRPYAGALSVGAHTHFDWHGWDAAMGADLVITGPQTHMTDVQEGLHNLIGFNEITNAVRDSQIPNGVHPTAVVELGRSFDTGTGQVRPFSEWRVGAETLWRVGVDVILGEFGRGELLVRDPVTGQRYRTIWNTQARGSSFVVGADVAGVHSSVFLPGNGTYRATDIRTRLRAGWHWQNDHTALFYGITWMSPEFTPQSEGQVVGSIRIRRRF